MKKWFTVLIVLFCLTMAKDASAQFQVPHSIPVQFVFEYPADTNGTLTIKHVLKSDVLTEGTPYTLNDFSPLPSSGAAWADAFDIFASSTFGFDMGAFPASDSVVLIKFTLGKLQPARKANGAAFMSVTDIALWMYLEISVTVYRKDQGLVTYNANQSYNFVPGKYATVKIPISNAFKGLWAKTFGAAPFTDIQFAYLVNGVFSLVGLDCSVSEANSLITARFSHFSKIGGGGKSLSVSGVEEKSINSLPGKFDLAQNYPNPFNPSTKIAYSIPDNGFVTMKVYNSIGAEVSTLVSGYKNAGRYEINFDAGNLPSGIYFYSLNMNGKTLTNKMMLVK